ncbi:MAG: 4Fe-4S dicluster domain-containing protein [Candidatus Aureabacteria bacterium]|nr:4Fe-4S dicluster domain-containing protein [Candidatus Auribacterota bacterium]
MNKHLKIVRVLSALFFFLCLSILFIDFYEFFVFKIKDFVLFFQFMPSVIHFKNSAVLLSSGFLLILIITFLFGRIYCSICCPIGILQDILLRLESFFKKRTFTYRPPFRIRYVFLIIALWALIFSNMLIYNLLDPFADFGKIMITLFRPVMIGINNALGSLLETHKIYLLFQTKYPTLNIASFLFALMYFFLLLIMTAGWGRLYCNTLCPVGSLLGLISRHALFKISLDKERCIQCKKCVQICKASCIDLLTQEADNSRCISCFNCLRVCPSHCIQYKMAPKNIHEAPFSLGKRFFIQSVLLNLASFLFFLKPGKSHAASLSAVKQSPVSPPGSRSLEHLTQNCISCHLCIGICPSNVLEPALFDYGINGIFQPKMNYNRSFCNYECFKCSLICPTGAIEKISKSEKLAVQMGKAYFYPEKCIVVTNKTDCGACAEICPTHAVRMVPFENGLMIPIVDDSYCIGCGACQYACPALPEKAILVNGNAIHETALIRKKIDQPVNYNARDDFPF